MDRRPCPTLTQWFVSSTLLRAMMLAATGGIGNERLRRAGSRARQLAQGRRCSPYLSRPEHDGSFANRMHANENRTSCTDDCSKVGRCSGDVAIAAHDSGRCESTTAPRRL